MIFTTGDTEVTEQETLGVGGFSAPSSTSSRRSPRPGEVARTGYAVPGEVSVNGVGLHEVLVESPRHDVTIAKRFIEGLGIGEGFFAGSFLEKAEPNSIRLTVVASEPVPKRRYGLKALYLLSHDFRSRAISHNTVAVFQFRVVALMESFFSKALFESLVFPYPFGQ